MLRLNLIGYNICMKTFIFLFLLLISFFVYLFVYTPAEKAKKVNFSNTSNSPTLDGIEKKMKEMTTTQKDNTTQNQEYTISENLRKSIVYQEDIPKPISEHIAFDTLVEIIFQVNPNYPKESITLNTPMDSVLIKKADRDLFKEMVRSSFKLSDSKIDELMKKNKLLWDWVNTLRQ